MALLNFATTYNEVSDKLHLEQSNTGDYIKLYFTQDGHIISHGVDYIPWGANGIIPIDRLPINNNEASSDYLWDSATIQNKINQSFAANDAMRFKGTIRLTSTNNYIINETEAEFPSKTAAVGDTYRVVSPGRYAGIQCEVGDLLICIQADPTGETTDWTVAQTNINGQIYHTINGVPKGFYSNDTDTFSIFAPTTAGAFGQVLTSKGGNSAPIWTDQSTIIAGDLTDAAKKDLFTNLTYIDDILTVTIGGTTRTTTISGRRAINVNSEEKLSTSDSTALNFINGNGVSFTWDSTNKNLLVNANTDYKTSRENKNYAVKTDDTTNNLYVNVPWIDTTYDVVSKDANGLAPQLTPNNGKFINQEFYLLAAENDQATPGWYRLSNNSLINTWRTIKVGGKSIGDKSLNFMPTGDIYVKTVDQNIDPDPDTDNEFDIGFGIAWYNISTSEYEYE